MKTEREIKVKCVEGFETYRNNEEETLLNEVGKGEILTAKIYKPTEEYFAKDSQGREVFVGEIDIKGALKLTPEFRLTMEDD